MAQETIDRILSLSRERNIVKAEYDECVKLKNILTDERYNLKQSNVLEFLDTIRDRYRFGSAIDDKDFWNAIHATIVTEWDKICDANKTKFDNINKQLTEL